MYKLIPFLFLAACSLYEAPPTEDASIDATGVDAAPVDACTPSPDAFVTTCNRICPYICTCWADHTNCDKVHCDAGDNCYCDNPADTCMPNPSECY